MRGVIVKGIAGFYYVRTEAEDAERRIYQCKARGIFKKDGTTPMVGDRVEITVLPDGDAVIDRILPRKNVFLRPPVANVDAFVVVTAAHDPEPNLAILDKFLVMAEKSHTEIIFCINKADLATKEELAALAAIYEPVYPVYTLSAREAGGTAALKEALAGKTAAFTGASGVGKSTIVNALLCAARMETGGVSEKTGRGRHTTRHAELFEMQGGGAIFDTPGFTAFETEEITEEELAHLFPEFAPLLGKCRYDNCRHLREPACAVREAVASGAVSRERYRSYAMQLLEIREKERIKYQ